MKLFFLLLMGVAACVATGVRGQLITTPEASVAAQVAGEVATELNQEFDRRVALHQRLFAKVWRNPQATPDAILAALGNQAGRLFQLSAENLEHLDRLAGILGKDVADFIAAEDRMPPRAVTVNANGTVTLAPP